LTKFENILKPVLEGVSLVLRKWKRAREWEHECTYNTHYVIITEQIKKLNKYLISNVPYRL